MLNGRCGIRPPSTAQGSGDGEDFRELGTNGVNLTWETSSSGCSQAQNIEDENVDENGLWKFKSWKKFSPPKQTEGFNS